MKPHPILLAGPTAVGKSAVAFALAKRCRGEIISVDSMQVYRGLDIGTAKPSSEEQAQVPHHMIDLIEPNQRFDAAQFARRAHQVVAEIQERGHVPILCGGTGLYFRAWQSGLGDAPAPDPDLRARLEATPLPALLDELARLDPVTFDTIDIDNPRRVIRAVEVIRLTGRAFSEQRARWPTQGAELAGRCFGFGRSREDLVRRIEDRVDAMFEHGLVAETQALLEQGLEGSSTAMQAIGYRQVVELLQGIWGLRETVERVKARTRQFAKRQGTWFKGQMDLEWIELTPNSEPEATVEILLERMSKTQGDSRQGKNLPTAGEGEGSK